MKSVGLLSNNPTLFIFLIPILMMIQGTRKQTTEPILGVAILGTNKLQPLLQ